MNHQILSIFIILGFILVIPFVNAQEFSIGEKASQKAVTVSISNEGDVHVKHVIRE